jgi:predicted ATPase
VSKLERVRAAGFRSIREVDIDVRDLNVLIGANGSGKSNFIKLFRLLNELVEERLQVAVATAGGANALLHFGRKASPT